MSSDIRQLLIIIEERLEWGAASNWQNRDFENLSQLIFEKTKVSLSESTLLRIWGRVKYKHLPSTTTLDTLARFAGYDSWRYFVSLNIKTDKKTKKATYSLVKPGPRARFWIKITCIMAVIIPITLISIYFIKQASGQINADNFSFSSRRLTSDIPNSVIFDYNADASPTDSVYIQQSWDPRTRALVSRHLHQHTSVYYEPGFYQAKLLIKNQVVKQHQLLIPTDGWLGLIENKPVPVYLKPADFVYKDMMRLSVSGILQKNMSMEPKPPIVKYYNVGNFAPVFMSDFSFSAHIKNDYREGAGACQLAAIILITDNAPIIIPLSVKGCASELNLLSVDRAVSGKTADLSGFGVSFADWVHVSCKGKDHKITYYVNNKQAYECAIPLKKIKIVGMSFNFQGTGSVKNIDLHNEDKQVFHAF